MLNRGSCILDGVETPKLLCEVLAPGFAYTLDAAEPGMASGVLKPLGDKLTAFRRRTIILRGGQVP